MKITTIWSIIIRLTQGMNRRRALSQKSLAVVLTVLAAGAADTGEAADRASSRGTVYFTVLNEQDYYNSNGERLRSVADILRQDRANYYQGRGGRRDEDDGGIFATKEGRSRFETYPIVLENLSAYDLINGRQTTIVVRVVGHKIYVEAVE
jgi:hypothetical protein